MRSGSESYVSNIEIKEYTYDIVSVYHSFNFQGVHRHALWKTKKIFQNKLTEV